jgi:hypothetical protein
MPHIDELLGAATFVSAGLFAAVSLQPINTGTAQTAVADGLAGAAIAATPASGEDVRCGRIEIVITRNGSADIQRTSKPIGDCAVKETTRPHA